MRILICDPISPRGLDLLKSSPHQVEEKYELLQDELREVISHYDAIVVRGRTKITRDIIAGSQLKLIARAGAGLDNIDVNAATERGIKVLSTPRAPSIAVAELALGLILALLREIPRADSALKQGNWIKKELMGGELRGKTLGIAGFGRIGRELAKRAKAFEADVQAYDVIDISHSAEELGVELSPSLEDLLSTSDIVSLHLPLLPETKHLLNSEKLARMKRTGLLVNTSRGGVIDESALLDAIRNNKLAGAALDVFEVEPPTSWELLQLPNVICTPHIGAQTHEAQDASGLEIAQSLLEEARKLS